LKTRDWVSPDTGLAWFLLLLVVVVRCCGN
jgi:hypothetical protein